MNTPTLFSSQPDIRVCCASDLTIVRQPFAVDRAELASFPAAYRAAYLLESGRWGVFQWHDGDFSSHVIADPQQGVYVPPTGENGTTGCWVRDYTGPVLATWFGAKPDGLTDNTTALLGMLSLIKAKGGSAKINSVPGSVNRYRTKNLRIQGPLPYPIGFECDLDAWLEKATLENYNLFDIYYCNYVALGNININMRQSEDPVIWDPYTDTNSGDNLGIGLTIRDCNWVSQVGRVRIYDMYIGMIVYSNVNVEIPVFHDVTFDYVELRGYVETDDDGHVITGGWAQLGILFANYADSGVRFVDVQGVMTKNPGFAIEFKVDCHRCWYGSFKAKQCWLAVSALGTGAIEGDPDPVDAKNCWFGPGLIDQCVSAIAMSHAEKVTFSHVRARHHPDQKWGTPELEAPGSTGAFVNFSGNSRDCTAMVEIIDFKGGPDNQPPIIIGGDRNTLIVPSINDNIPVYATIVPGADHSHIAIWHDTTLTSAPNMRTKFDDQSEGLYNTYSVNGGGSINFRAAKTGIFKADSNEFSVALDEDGDAGISGLNYLQVSAEHFNSKGIQRADVVDGFSILVGGHTALYVLEGTVAMSNGIVHFPAGSRGKTITVVCTQNVAHTNFIPASGAEAIVGIPASLTANEPVTFRFLDDTMKWYRA